MRSGGSSPMPRMNCRTPVAVLKAHVAILSRFEGHAELAEEIGSLERLVNQLLDVARLDVLQLGADNVADLGSVATEVASHLAPAAIDRGRSIEVVAPDEPVRIRGASDYLFRALRNIVENALAVRAGGHDGLHRGRQSTGDQRHRQGPRYAA